uniref:MKLP1_Arf_bdg domain-containing protein n=1 Tax=Macrostomum lignano TaxID=282301 RepID=A0A1I8FGA7_9PLAT
ATAAQQQQQLAQELLAEVARPAGDASVGRRQVHWRRRQPAAQQLRDQLIAENAELRAEADRLRDEMIRLQMRNGVAQVPLLRRSRRRLPTVALRRLALPLRSPKQIPKPAAPQPLLLLLLLIKNRARLPDKAKDSGKPAESKKTAGKEPAAADGGLDVTRLDLRVGPHCVRREAPGRRCALRWKLSTLARSAANHCERAWLRMFHCRTAGPASRLPAEPEAGQNARHLQRRHDHSKPCRLARRLAPGDRVSVAGCPSPGRAASGRAAQSEEEDLEALKPHCLVDADGYAGFNGARWLVAGKGEVRAPSLKSAQISSSYHAAGTVLRAE